MVSAETIRWALGRLDDFMAIHPPGSLDDPINFLLEGYGFDSEVCGRLADWFEDAEVPDDRRAEVLLGILIGTIAGEYEPHST